MSEMIRLKPILFNSDMVNAILSGKKTVTRRLVKPSQVIGFLPNRCKNGTPEEFIKEKPLLFLPYCNMQDDKLISTIYKNPYQIGDILYVRETWRIGAWNEELSTIAVDYKADGYIRKEWIPVQEPQFQKYWIQSTEEARKAGLIPDKDGQYHWEHGKAPTHWRPSIFMPKEAARIFLKVKDVRVERLQDITVKQVISEGCADLWIDEAQTMKLIEVAGNKNEFTDLWNSTTQKSVLDRYGWDANPWVWVIEFEKISKKEVFTK